MFALINPFLKSRKGRPYLFNDKTYRARAALLSDIRCVQGFYRLCGKPVSDLTDTELKGFAIVDIPMRDFAERFLSLEESSPRLSIIKKKFDNNGSYFVFLGKQTKFFDIIKAHNAESILGQTLGVTLKNELKRRGLSEPENPSADFPFDADGSVPDTPAPAPAQPTPTEQPVDMSNPFGPLEAAIKGMVTTALSGAGIDEASIRRRIDSSLSTAKAKVENDAAKIIDAVKSRSDQLEQAIRDMKPIVEKHVIEVQDIPAVEFNHSHKALPEIVKTIAALRKNNANDKCNIALVGPAGTGKTTLGSQVAETFNVPFHALNMSEGVSEAHLTERILPNTQGEGWTKTLQRFAEVYRDGGVFLMDEFDAADPNVLVALHSALDNGILPLPCGDSIARHEDCILIVTMNTYGQGADRLYTGRSTLDAATRNRFTGRMFFIDYDEGLEDNLTQSRGLRVKLRTIRKKVAKAELEQIVSTRDLVVLDTLVASGVCTEDEAVARLTMGWSPDEKSTVGLS